MVSYAKRVILLTILYNMGIDTNSNGIIRLSSTVIERHKMLDGSTWDGAVQWDHPSNCVAYWLNHWTLQTTQGVPWCIDGEGENVYPIIVCMMMSTTKSHA